MLLLQNAPFHIEQMDAVDFIKQLPRDSVDLIVTDPAYESLEKHRSVGTTTRLKKKWFEIFKNDRYLDLLHEMHAVLKKGGHTYILCDEETRDVLRPLVSDVGFTWQKSLVWSKERRGMGYNYPASYEFIAFLKKGKGRKLATNNHWDVLKYQSIRSDDAYPTEKPVELLEVLITESSAPGEIVLDPFMGSGSTGLAALKNCRQFLGCDTSEDALNTSRSRLEAYRAQMLAFLR